MERTLTNSQRDEFEDMLRALTLERSQIKEAMGFALDNADAAGEVMPTFQRDLACLMSNKIRLNNSATYITHIAAWRSINRLMIICNNEVVELTGSCGHG